VRLSTRALYDMYEGWEYMATQANHAIADVWQVGVRTAGMFYVEPLGWYF
jgi:hypothetical protein